MKYKYEMRFEWAEGAGEGGSKILWEEKKRTLERARERMNE